MSTSFTVIYSKKCFDKIQNFYQDALFYVHSISQQTYSFTTKSPCDGNPAYIIHLNPDDNEYLFTNTSSHKTRPRSFETWNS